MFLTYATVLMASLLMLESNFAVRSIAVVLASSLKFRFSAEPLEWGM